jgi:hypothetical protein
MYIYTLKPEDQEIFESLKTFQFDESDLPPWESNYVKEMHPMYGIKRPDLSERNRLNSGNNHRASKEGYVHNRLGTTASDETRAKMRKSRLGKPPGNKGKSPSEETRKKISESLTGQPAWNLGISASDQTKQLLKEKRKGKVWWNNGERCSMSVTSPGPEWIRGRL